MNIFTIFLFLFFSKIFSKTHQLIAPFLKKLSRGAYPRTPLANAWLGHPQHGAKRHANTPTFTKKIEPPPK